MRVKFKHEWRIEHDFVSDGTPMYVSMMQKQVDEQTLISRYAFTQDEIQTLSSENKFVHEDYQAYSDFFADERVLRLVNDVNVEKLSIDYSDYVRVEYRTPVPYGSSFVESTGFIASWHVQRPYAKFADESPEMMSHDREGVCVNCEEPIKFINTSIDGIAFHTKTNLIFCDGEPL